MCVNWKGIMTYYCFTRIVMKNRNKSNYEIKVSFTDRIICAKQLFTFLDQPSYHYTYFLLNQEAEFHTSKYA